jgi:hypothetical protein
MMPVFGKEIVKELNRPLIKDMTSQELYALDFAKMEPGERAAFRDELHEKPGHGPLAPAAEHRIYAEAHARWSDWIKDHPEDDDDTISVSDIPEQGAKAHLGETKPLTGSSSQPADPKPPAPPQPRPDGTSPRRPQGTGL